MKHLKKNPLVQRMEDMKIPGSRKFPTKKVKGLYRVTYGDVDMGSELTLDKLEAMEKDMRKGFENEAWEVEDDQYQGCFKRTWTKVKAGKCSYHPREPAVLMSANHAYNLCQKCLDKNRSKVTMTGREYLRSINDDNGFTLMPRIVWRVVAVVILVIIL